MDLQAVADHPGPCSVIETVSDFADEVIYPRLSEAKLTWLRERPQRLVDLLDRVVGPVRRMPMIAEPGPEPSS